MSKSLSPPAGGDGADAHVDEFLDIIKEIVGDAKNKCASFT